MRARLLDWRPERPTISGGVVSLDCFFDKKYHLQQKQRLAGGRRDQPQNLRGMWQQVLQKNDV
jgi:hypothetical protein